jgi:hypothetical protein
VRGPREGPKAAADPILTYRARVYPPLLGRVRATVKVTRGGAFHVDTFDLYASRSRAEFTKRVAKTLGVEAEGVERDLLALLVEAEQLPGEAEPPARAHCGVRNRECP